MCLNSPSSTGVSLYKLRRRLRTLHAPHNTVERTPNSLPSYVALAIGRGSPSVLTVMKRGLTPTNENGVVHWRYSDTARFIAGCTREGVSCPWVSSGTPGQRRR